MKLIDNTIYIEFAELVGVGIPANTLKNAKLRNSPSWPFIQDPNDKRKVLMPFEKLKDEYKRKIEIRYGDVYEYMAKQPIKNLVKFDDKAEAFFLAYKYDDNKVLSSEHVKKYTIAANWLNMFKEVLQDKKQLKKMLNMTVEEFFNHVIDIITIDKIDLPATYKRLLETRREYEANGYASLISARFGNKFAAKIIDELSESTLLEMIAHNNQYDDVFVAIQYNKWAKKNNYKAIDPKTVGHHRRKKDHLIVMQREGNAELKGTYLKQAKGFRPTAPLLLVESDDNHLDLLFIDVDDTTPHKFYHKYKTIVVTDSFNDYVLGYAYAEKLSPELVRAAYMNAMYYIRSITGQWYLPHETKTDRWALKELQPLYKSLGNYFPTPVGSKNRGYIENFFGSAHWKRCLKAGANNYTGNNITAKFRGVNQEALERNKKDRPLIGDEAAQQIENAFHNMRFMPQSNGKSKHEVWMEAWSTMAEGGKRAISDEQFLMKLGIEHNHNGEGLRITNRGVRPIINGVQYSFDLKDYNMADINKRVVVLYDPFDMSRVLVTDHEQFRMMAYDARLNSRALADSNTDSRTYLNSILNEKKADVNLIATKKERRELVLASAGVDPETLLQAGVMTKELKQSAEQRRLAPPTQYEEDYLDQL